MRRVVAGVGLGIVLLAVLAACGPAPLGPKETAIKWLQAMEQRDTVTAWNLLSLDAQATISSEEFAAMIEETWTETKLVSFKVKAVQEPIIFRNGTRASVPYAATLTTQDGTPTDVYNALSLVRQNEQWRVIWPPVH